jgi:hypothetical protein
MKYLAVTLAVVTGIIALAYLPCPARDFIVQFEEEYYKETSASFSYAPLIYHSIQVSSDAGSKLLVLTGDDNYYRRWLRQFIAQGKSFIVNVPDEQADQFVRNHVFDIEVNAVHPLDLALYKKGQEKSARMSELTLDMDDSSTSSSALGVNPQARHLKDRIARAQTARDKNKENAKRLPEKKGRS